MQYFYCLIIQRCFYLFNDVAFIHTKRCYILPTMMDIAHIYVDVRILRIKHKMNHPRAGWCCYDGHLPQQVRLWCGLPPYPCAGLMCLSSSIYACVVMQYMVVFSCFHYADDNFQHKNEKPHARFERQQQQQWHIWSTQARVQKRALQVYTLTYLFLWWNVKNTKLS